MRNKDLFTSTETERKKITNRADWLAERYNGIGASEAAAIVGMSPYKTATELWEQKSLRLEQKDISDNEAVARGIRFEPALRELFKVAHPEWEIEHHPYDMLYQKNRPWLFATLDGEIKDEDSKCGILEIKTATFNSRTRWKWEHQIPPYYFTQVLHQMLATDYDFVILYACLIGDDGDMDIREYRFDKSDCAEDMAWLLEQEEQFWKSVTEEDIPSIKISL